MGTSEKEELTFFDTAIAAAATEDMYGPDVDRYCDMCIQHTAARNETSGGTHTLLGKKRGDQIWWVEDQVNPVAGVLYGHHDPIHLYHGSKIIIRFEGITQGDDLEIHLLGYIQSTR